MTEFYTVKRIDNTRVVRAAAPRRLRECAKLVAMGGALALVALFYSWQHFQYIQLSYQVERLRTDHAHAFELNQELKLDVSNLRSPTRIDGIARNQLGLTATVPGQTVTAQSPSDGAVVAQVRRVQPPPAQ
jgi:cell division protein FtsL